MILMKSYIEYFRNKKEISFNLALIEFKNSKYYMVQFDCADFQNSPPLPTQPKLKKKFAFATLFFRIKFSWKLWFLDQFMIFGSLCSLVSHRRRSVSAFHSAYLHCHLVRKIGSQGRSHRK